MRNLFHDSGERPPATGSDQEPLHPLSESKPTYTRRQVLGLLGLLVNRAMIGSALGMSIARLAVENEEAIGDALDHVIDAEALRRMQEITDTSWRIFATLHERARGTDLVEFKPPKDLGNGRVDRTLCVKNVVGDQLVYSDLSVEVSTLYGVNYVTIQTYLSDHPGQNQNTTQEARYDLPLGVDWRKIISDPLLGENDFYEVLKLHGAFEKPPTLYEYTVYTTTQASDSGVSVTYPSTRGSVHCGSDEVSAGWSDKDTLTRFESARRDELEFWYARGIALEHGEKFVDTIDTLLNG